MKHPLNSAPAMKVYQFSDMVKVKWLSLHLNFHENILKLGWFGNLLDVLVFCKGWIVIRLQTVFPAALFDNPVLLSVATLAAATTSLATEAHCWCHNLIPWCQGAQRSWQKVPVLEELGQKSRAPRLHDVDYDHNDNQHNNGHTDTNKNLPASDGQA